MAKTVTANKTTDVESHGDEKPTTDTLTSTRQKQSRMEKKSRKAVSRLGLEPVPDVVRIAIKKSKHVLFTIVNPDVYKCPNSDKYIIFGDAHLEDVANQGKVYVPPTSSATPEPTEEVKNIDSVKSEVQSKSASSNDTKIDEADCDPQDIDLIVQQCRCSREKAIEALCQNGQDLVGAIMSLK